VEKYDPAIGGFSTYAVIKIKGNLYNYLRDKSTLIRVPRGSHEVQRKWNQAKNQLTKKIKRLPTMQEIAEFSGIKLESYLKAEQVVNQCRSIGDLNVTLDSPINQRFEDFMKEIVCNYSKLSTFQQQILTLFVFKSLTIRDICKVTEQSKQDVKTALIEACNLAELTIN
jgi:DNA-directed RNA polymerase specialized sigma subunit